MWPLSRIPALRGISASMHKIFEPLDFIAKLASLAPKPRVNLTRFHGVLLRASCPAPFGPACGCSKSLPAILSRRTANTASRSRPQVAARVKRKMTRNTRTKHRTSDARPGSVFCSSVLASLLHSTSSIHGVVQNRQPCHPWQ